MTFIKEIIKCPDCRTTVEIGATQGVEVVFKIFCPICEEYFYWRNTGDEYA